MKIALAIAQTHHVFSDISPPHNLALLAACIRREFPQVTIKMFDEAVETDILHKILAWNPDVLGISATTSQIIDAYELLDYIRRHTQIYTMIGGIHASSLPQEAAKHADLVCVGDGEKAIVQIVKNLLNHNENPHIVYGEPTEDLNSLPRAAWDLLNMDFYLNVGARSTYWKSSGTKNVLPMFRFQSSRGCNFKCPFCYNSKRIGKVRFYSAPRMIDEIEYFIQHHHINSIWFDDDDFLANKKRLHEWANLWQAKGFHHWLTWACQARVTDIDHETVHLMKENGCVAIFLGIESINKTALNYLKCGTVTKQRIEAAVDLFYRHGLTVFGSFIFGAPNESLQEMQETMNWICEYRKKGLTLSYCSLLRVYPSTTLFDYAVQEGIISPDKIDYVKMAATTWHEPSSTYVVDKAVNQKDLRSFLHYANENLWLYNQVAIHNKKAFLTRTFIKYVLRHSTELPVILRDMFR